MCFKRNYSRCCVHPVMQCHDMVIKDQYTCAKSEQVIRDNGFQVNDSPHHSKLSNVPLRGPIMSPHLSKTTYPLCLPRMSRWPTPMKGKFLIRWYCADTDGVQPVPQAGAVAVMSEAEIAANDDDSNLEVIYLPTDFDWHRHIAMGTFLYRGCVLRINSTPLLQYVSQNTMMEFRAIYGDPSGKSEWFVKDIAKGHISSLMDSLDEFHSQGLCIEELDDSKVVICDGIAKFSADIRLILANDDRRTANWVKLVGIISDTLFEGRELPYSMKHLLMIMRTQPLTSVTYMKSHVGLLRQVNKTASFMRLYDSLHALRVRLVRVLFCFQKSKKS
ncbi:uncharacterized protein LOC100842009 isoform X2 [Brachypodium distachyon]|nr:uncharacterized protein LOC100842009 isoform X2 [Brachypodium distachyon]KQK23685.1 hypothetical protein BRADI_1g75388v3 [Brachypodium distachyon]PNT78218.1 hypothetical protein BRADI_1g75388v3 [Brachypodium distachyon]|eukprot:XP_024313697.1 uncharacterized protein LOC100842009 isoform X2 [Brachypodium distachyon]